MTEEEREELKKAGWILKPLTPLQEAREKIREKKRIAQEGASYNRAMESAKRAELREEKRSAAKTETEEIKEGAIYARQLIQREKEKEKQAAQRGKTVAKIGTKIVGRVKGALGGIVPQTIKLIPKGLTHPDSLIRNRELYLPSNPTATPLGRPITDWKELYFGRSQRGMPEGTNIIFSAHQQGYTDDQLEVITGMQPPQISRCIQYLRQKGLWEEEWE